MAGEMEKRAREPLWIRLCRWWHFLCPICGDKLKEAYFLPDGFRDVDSGYSTGTCETHGTVRR